MYYTVGKIDGEYLVRNNLTGEVEKTVTDETKAQVAFQYAYDNAPDVAAIGILSAGLNNPYIFDAPFVIDTEATTLAGMPRHGVKLKPKSGAGVSEVIKVNYGTTLHCTVLYGLKFDGNNESTDAIHIYETGGTQFRILNCHWSSAVGGWGIYNETAKEILLLGQGNVQGDAGDIYSDADVWRDPVGIRRANIDGGTGEIAFGNRFGNIIMEDGAYIDNLGKINGWSGTNAAIAFGDADDSQPFIMFRESDSKILLKVLADRGMVTFPQSFNPALSESIRFQSSCECLDRFFQDVTGSAGIGIDFDGFTLTTGTTAGSTAELLANLQYVGANPPTWGKGRYCKFNFNITDLTEEAHIGTGRVQPGSLAANQHISIRLQGGDIQGESCDGVARTQTTLISGASTGNHTAYIEWDDPYIRFWIDKNPEENTPDGTITTNQPSGTGSAERIVGMMVTNPDGVDYGLRPATIDVVQLA